MGSSAPMGLRGGGVAPSVQSSPAHSIHSSLRHTVPGTPHRRYVVP
jgi:hypothetical protein